MLVVNSARAAGVRYWESSAVNATWLGKGAVLLGLGGREVDGHVLANLLAGQAPSGGALTPRPKLRRREGWDLVFGAPKSVSLLASSAIGPVAGELAASYRQAIAEAFSVLEANAAWVSSRGRPVRALGIVGAAFEHLHSHAGQPHLHTHVVLANLGALDEHRWGCLNGRELWHWRQAAGACFQLALRARLAQAGLAFDWELSGGGLGEVACLVPATTGASSRALAVRAGALRFGRPSSRVARVSQGQSRQAAASPRARLPLASAELEGTLSSARERAKCALPAPPPSQYAVAKALAERSSFFGEPEVLVALAEVLPEGLPAQEALAWAKGFCATSHPTSPPSQRWTTSLASHFDHQVRAGALEGRSAGLAQACPGLAWQELEALGTSALVGAGAVRLACSGAAVEALPRAPWLAQAACIDAARAIWQAAGMTVSVAAPSAASQARWRALTSLRPGTSGSPGKRVLVVDAADHLGPAALSRLVSQAGAAGTKLVLVPGGTAPTSRESMAVSLEELVDASDITVGREEPSIVAKTVSVPGLAVKGAYTGRGAMGAVLSSWAALWARGEPALMVALGPAEAEKLNLAARELLGYPPLGSLGELAYGQGEQVMALRRLGPARAGTLGRVVAVEGSALWVSWAGGPTSAVAGEQASLLGHGYATTVPYLRRAGQGQQLLLLGDPYVVGEHQVAASWVTVGGPGVPAAGPGGEEARWRAGIAEIATSWPDEEMLEAAGPRPLAPSLQRRWAELVTSHALERATGALAAQLDRSGAPSLRTGRSRDLLSLGAPACDPGPLRRRGLALGP